MTPALGMLDQSPVISGHTPAEAVAETVRLAEAAERLGYSRYWLAEHHAIAALADPCPEILAARVAAATSRIRVGTGGVLLPYYSALKIAEQFRMLEALFPGRIDLGIGRAPGGDRLTAQAVARGPYAFADDFPEQVRDLVGFLDASLPPEHPFAPVKAMPAGATSPEVWLLGSSDYSGALAADLGLRFAFAHFISARGGDAVTRAYREDFRPSARDAAPRAIGMRVRDLCGNRGQKPSGSRARSISGGYTWHSASIRRCLLQKKRRRTVTATASAPSCSRSASDSSTAPQTRSVTSSSRSPSGSPPTS